MYPVDTASVAHAAQDAVKNVGVDLKKRYRIALDVVYSETMGRKPKVPTFGKAQDEASAD